MREAELHIALKIAGYATLAGFFVSALTRNMLRLRRAKELGVSDELLSETAIIYLFGAAVESPLHISTGLLCLYAAFHLKRKLKPISETFE